MTNMHPGYLPARTLGHGVQCLHDSMTHHLVCCPPHHTLQWSFGVTCWEVYSGGKAPYAGVDRLSLIHMLEDGGRMEKPRNSACSDSMCVTCLCT